MNKPSNLAGRKALGEIIDIQRLKDSIRLSDVVSRHTSLRRSGQSLIGLCPFHKEQNASFVVTDEIGVYYCHGCGATGDVIDFVRAIPGCDFLDAVRWISGAIPAITVHAYREQSRKLDRATRALSITYARFQWEETIAIEGTPAERYLRSRGINGQIPSTLRFGTPPLWVNVRSGHKGPRLPALVAACHDGTGSISGVQRIFLRRDGTLAPLRQPKLNLGQIRGGALRLGPEAPELLICEGPEDGLTLHEMLSSTPVWVALGSRNMAAMTLPPCVKRVLVAGDDNKAGREAAQEACEAFRAQGRQAAAIYPGEAYEDFNDQLRSRGRKP